MKDYLKHRIFTALNFLVVLIILGIFEFPHFIESRTQMDEVNIISEELSGLATFQGNTLVALPNLVDPDVKVNRVIQAVVTAYSSTEAETDETPFITASGKQVEDGIVANNGLPIGTKIRIPELYGDKIFVVEDRMSWQKSNYHFDIWFSSYWEAKNFGAKRTYIEVLKS
jgi:3D (Asp-Asp-Asp) domain-containing protein